MWKTKNMVVYVYHRNIYIYMMSTELYISCPELKYKLFFITTNFKLIKQYLYSKKIIEQISWICDDRHMLSFADIIFNKCYSPKIKCSIFEYL